jgi:spire-like protein
MTFGYFHFSDDDDRYEANEVTEDDEGIEQDHDEDENFSGPKSNPEVLKAVIDACASHLSVSGEAESHYRNVCRALVSEAMAFTSFMKRTKEPDIFDKELDLLDRVDWANLWEKTMNDLRQGVKLNKTDFSKTPIEFALTPYEMLMDDIR